MNHCLLQACGLSWGKDAGDWKISHYGRSDSGGHLSQNKIWSSCDDVAKKTDPSGRNTEYVGGKMNESDGEHGEERSYQTQRFGT